MPACVANPFQRREDLQQLRLGVGAAAKIAVDRGAQRRHVLAHHLAELAQRAQTRRGVEAGIPLGLLLGEGLREGRERGGNVLEIQL